MCFVAFTKVVKVYWHILYIVGIIFNPLKVVEFINQYEKQGIITIDDEQRICLTPKGRNEISTILNELKIKLEHKSHYFESIKSNDTIGIFEPYLPDINFYNRYEGEKQKETSK